MKTNYKLFLPFLFLPFLLWQCRDDDDGGMVDSNGEPCGRNASQNDCVPKGVDTVFVDTELSAYYFFPVDSWWVYERTDTNATVYDTVRVYETTNRIRYDDRDFSYAWQELMCKMEHTYYPSFPQFWEGQYGFRQLRFQLNNSGGSPNTLESDVFGKGFSSYRNFFSTPVDSISILNNSMGSGGGSFLYSEDNIVLNSQLFTNVAHLNIRGSILNDTILFSKNVGIIKFYNTDVQHSWQLVDYHINN